MVSLKTSSVMVTSISIPSMGHAFLHPIYNSAKLIASREIRPESNMLLLMNPVASIVPEEKVDGPVIDEIDIPLSLAYKLNVHYSRSIEHTHPVEVVGHRGSVYTALENTSRSFLHAAEAGADSVELDVFLLKCGTLVVFHGTGSDEKPGLLDMYCGVEGSILDYTAEEAKKSLKFNKDFSEFGCGPNHITHPEDLYTEVFGQEPIDHYCYVHTLEEVLTTLRDHPNVPQTLAVKIELKGEGTAAPAVQLVERLNMMHRCHYSSFDHSKIAEVRAMNPSARTGALFADDVPEDFIQRVLAIGASEVHLKYDTCTYERIQAAHNAGLGTMAWFRGPIGMEEDATFKYQDVGNEDENMYEVVLRSGVKSMCVNRPDVMSSLADKLQRRIIWGSFLPIVKGTCVGVQTHTNLISYCR